MTRIIGIMPTGEQVLIERPIPMSAEEVYWDARRQAAIDLKRAQEILNTTREDWQAEEAWPQRDEEIARSIKRRTLDVGGGRTVLAHKPGTYVHPQTGQHYVLRGVLGWYSTGGGAGSTGWPTFWQDLIPLAEWEAQQ